MSGLRKVHWFAPTRVLVLLLFGGCASSTVQTVCPQSPFRSPKPLVIAHASGDYLGPANSIEMLQSSLNAGADVLDIDVRVTKDGVLVAGHDDQVGRVSIRGSTYAELARVDLRNGWRNPLALSIKEPVRIPTVEASLTAFPAQRFSLEFKTTGGEQVLCDLLRSSKRTSSVYVSSAGDAAINTFADLCPEVTTTVTDAMVPVLQAARAEGQKWCSPVPIGQPPIDGVDAESVKWSQDHGLAVFSWTADDESSIRTLINAGVDGIYTGRPDLARQLIDE